MIDTKNTDWPEILGEMGEFLHKKDWTKTSLGARKEWPPILQTAINMILAANHPMLILWGDELICIYNDAYSHLIGSERHPSKFGEPGDIFFEDEWEELGPVIKEVYHGEKSVWEENHLVPFLRHGEVEDVYWTYNQSPIIAEDNTIKGVLVTCIDTTQTITAEQKLRESSEHFQVALDTGKLGSWQLDVKDNNLTVSNFTLKLLGLAPDSQLSYKQLLRMIHHEDRKKWKEAVRRAFEGKSNFEIEFRIFWTTGEEHWFFSRAQPFFASDDTPLRMIGVIQNITERKRNDQLLEEQKRLMELIASGTAPEECLSTLCSTVSKFSPGVRASILLADKQKEKFDRSIAPEMKSSFQKELEGIPISKQHISTCSQAVYRGTPILCENLNEDERWSDEWRNICLNNNIQATYSNPIPGQGGSYLGAFMLALDEPRVPNEWEKKLSEFGSNISGIAIEWEREKQALRESEERMRHILDSAKEYAIITIDSNGLITGWNEGASRILGYNEGEILGKHVKIFFTSEDRKNNESEKEIKQAQSNGRAENERWHIRKDGSRFWSSGVMLPLLKSSQGGFVKIFRDNTEQRDIEVALKNSEHKYRSLFDTIDEGFCILEKAKTDPNEPDNFFFLETNPAFNEQTGFTNVEGMTIRELVPDMAEAWVKNLNQVLETGEPLHIEDYLSSMNRSFEVNAFAVGGEDLQRVAILLINITERKKLEMILRKNEERATYFTTLNDALRALSEPAAIQDEAVRVLAEHLGAHRVCYSEVRSDKSVKTLTDYTDGVESITGVHNIADYRNDFFEKLESGITVVSQNVDEESHLTKHQKSLLDKLQVKAHVTVPLIKRKRLEAIIDVHHAAPREWNTDEISLIEETAARTFTYLEQARAEKKLRRSEKKYRSFFNSIDEGFCIMEKVSTAEGEPSDFRYVEINPAFEHQSGMPDPVGETLRELLPDIDPVWIQNYDQVLKTGEPMRFEINLKTPDRILNIYAFPAGDPEGQQVAVIFNDITEQRKTESDLRKSGERLKAALEGTEVGVYDYNLKTKSAWRSAKHDQIFGYSSALPGWNYFTFMEHVIPADHDKVKEKLEQAVHTYGKWNFECRIIRDDGEQRWINVHGQVLQGAGESNDKRIVGTIQDITERKQDEEKLEAINETLEERVEERTEALLSYQQQLRSLASQLSKAEENERQRLAADLHDNLGQLLAMCKLELDLIDGQSTEAPNLDQLTDLINQSIIYTRELMSDLKPPPSLDSKDIAGALEWVANRMKKHGLKVTLKDDNTPKPLREEIRSVLIQSVRELLFNVVKHAKVKQAKVEISRTDDEILVSVIDKGKGFNIKNKKLALDEEGGFGLFNVQERMDLLGGKMKVLSSPGKGTKIKLYAPLLEDKARETPSHQNGASLQTEIHYRETDKIRVLLVDDHQMMLKGLRKILEQEEDLTVIAEATNGKEAVKLARETHPDVIVMDVDMPIMNGIDATREIMRLTDNVRVIGLSLHGKGSVAKAMREAGASAYLTKTEAFEALSATIRSEAVLVKK